MLRRKAPRDDEGRREYVERKGKNVKAKKKRQKGIRNARKVRGTDG
jgi:hypothetical protein